MKPHRLQTVPAVEVRRRATADAVPEEVLSQARTIVERVRGEGDGALLEYCRQFGDLADGETLFIDRAALEQQADSLSRESRSRLESIRARIETFARAQRGALAEISIRVPGGRAGHEIAPIERAGCYAPGGLYPLPSSVLMTVVTARVAGVSEIWVASPRPTAVTLATAGLAGANGLLAAGGAHAVAALAVGTERFKPCDVIVGPGNVWVTAAKKILAGEVAIDLLAGPSEVVILAEEDTRADLVAADLLAQAEHAADALPLLVTTSPELVKRVEKELDRQLAGLTTRKVAEQALANGAAILCRDLDEAFRVCDRLAPEHLQLFVKDPQTAARRLRHYGSLFLGQHSPTALGDYGVGPNHVLPTGGTARSRGGLSVLSFLRLRTWLQIEDQAGAAELYREAAWLARQEGLEAHARSLERRRRS